MLTTKQQRIQDIAKQNFIQSTKEEIQTWLRGAIIEWTNSHSVMAFSPFENFFPSVQEESASLAQIFAALPTEKNSGTAFSLQDHFRIALSNIITTDELYDQPNCWRFMLHLASEVRLNECMDALIPILSNDNLKERIQNQGFSLLEELLEMSFTLDLSLKVVGFWRAAANYIDETPNLSNQLFTRLVQADPENWAKWALDTKMKTALIRFHQTQLKEMNNLTVQNYYLRLQKYISEHLSDQVYLSGAGQLFYTAPELKFLLDSERCESLESPQDRNKWEEFFEKIRDGGRDRFKTLNHTFALVNFPLCEQEVA